ncbi:MAG: hypothetical protein HC915_17600 [Anaerolineae bacterium]|nr:hypothetical protein [Anaerolineae bacterium]
MPYPHAWRYQKVNAEWLTSRGAALTLADEALGSELLPTLHALLQDPAQREALQNAAAELARSDGAENIAKALLAL